MGDAKVIPNTFEELLEAEEYFAEIRINYWLKHDLYTWQWWLLLALLVIPWYFWWKLADKSKLKDIVIVGALMVIIALNIDELGTEFNQWDYPHRLIPIYPQIMPVDLTILPIFYMLLYQYCPRWQSYIPMLVIMSGMLAFIFEPLLNRLDMYKTIDWKYMYSFPIYSLIGIFLKLMVEKIKAISERTRK